MTEEEIPVLEKLTTTEINEILDEVGLPCCVGLDGCDWIPLKTTPQEQEILAFAAFQRKLLDNMVGCPPEFNAVFVDNLEDLLA
jgi:hypothetical protein